MGKSDEEQIAAGVPESLEVISDGNAVVSCPRCRPIGRIVRIRCIVAVLFGAAVLLSALFWLPPFARMDPGDTDRDSQFSADIVASFMLNKPSHLVNLNIKELEYDIFEEIGVPNSMVVVISLETAEDANWTNVVFGIWPYLKNSTISSAGLSILKSSLVSLVLHQSTLDLTTSLFGYSSLFQLLKFPGGITIVPPQNAFLLQKVHNLFNFTLNFSIVQVQNKFEELTNQMKSGLLLNSYENLYVILTNLKGSTVSPPTIVQTSVVLAIGNLQPSLPRLKQLAQTIRNSSLGNLGLNHTVFGRVKQIRLSSFLQRSLVSGSAPSPAPHLPESHHHHQHNHLRHHLDSHLAPSPSSTHHFLAPSPSPRKSCTLWMSSRHHRAPESAPSVPNHHVYGNLAPDSSYFPSKSPSSTPNFHEHVPAPAPFLLPSFPPYSNFRSLQPPSYGAIAPKPRFGAPAISPSPSPSSVSSAPGGSLTRRVCFFVPPILHYLLIYW